LTSAGAVFQGTDKQDGEPPVFRGSIVTKNLAEQILYLAKAFPGLTDRQIADRLSGEEVSHHVVDLAVQALVRKGKLVQEDHPDGKIGCYLSGETGLRAVDEELEAPAPEGSGKPVLNMPEEEVKRNVENWLKASGWDVQVNWGAGRGIDIEARRGNQRWVIEAKGSGSSKPTKNTHFSVLLGEALQRMDDPYTRYGIAFPDTNRYRKLWAKLPALAKSRLRLEVLFVRSDGRIRFME